MLGPFVQSTSDEGSETVKSRADAVHRDVETLISSKVVDAALGPIGLSDSV